MRSYSSFAVLFLILTFSAATAADTSNRTLFGNRAVQRELRLSPEQRERISAILTEMEADIAKQVQDDPAKEAEIVNGALVKQGPRLEQVLNRQQANRIWQIGMQASGPAAFNSNRVRRVLNLTDEQLAKMAEESDKMVKFVTRIATDPKLELKTIQRQTELAKQVCYKAQLALLTTDQLRDFQGLIGEPFDLELLKHSDGGPRALTFVFGVDGKNAFVLLSSPQLRKDLGVLDSQWTQIQGLMLRTDEKMTAVRLAILKKADQDFRDLNLKEQQQLVREILDETAPILLETNLQVRQILARDQAKNLDKSLVQAIGARALETESIAVQINLTGEQKLKLATLIKDFETNTAPLRVVTTQSKFDAKTYELHLAKLEAAARSLLVPEQAQLLLEIAK